MPKKQNLIGERFGLWTVIASTRKRSSGGNIVWRCRCEGCGEEREVDGSNLAAGRSTNCGKTICSNILDGGAPVESAEGGDTPNTIEADIDDSAGRGTLTSVRSLDIKTLDDLLAHSNVDLDTWTVTRHVVNSWEVTMGRNASGAGVPKTYTNYQVKAWLERKTPSSVEQSIEALIERLPVLDVEATPVPDDGPDSFTMELCLYDHHFGLLSWHAETGEDYDVRIAQRVFLFAVDQVLAQARQYPISKIVVPVGNDFFHINDPSKLTPRGQNQLDTDCRIAKVFEVGEITIIESIRRMAGIAPVEVIFIPGNHDPETGYYLCRVLARCFESCEGVTVDASPIARKYRRFGSALIGYTHLSDEKEADLPVLMATEEPDAWADAVRENAAREWHVGHLHKKRERVYTKGDSYAGVYVRHLQSLCGTDAWHFKKGYIRTMRAVEAFLWHQRGAFCAHIEHRIPQAMYTQGLGEEGVA